MKSNLHNGASRILFDNARKLRGSETHAELVLWGYLKTKPFGCKFRRQHPYGIYILDFYCHQLKLVIEVDGAIHDDEVVKRKDEERQHLLEAEGLIVLRFKNEAVLSKLDTIIITIEQYIKDHHDRNK
jgi:cyclase